MQQKRMWLAALALATTLFGSAAYAVVEVSSCRALNQAGETYRLTQDVTTTGSCFAISAPGVTLDGDDGNGGRYTITYATQFDGRAVAVQAGGAEIRNLTIRNGAHANGSNNGTTAIYTVTPEVNIHHNAFDLTNNGTAYFSAIRLPESSATNLLIQHNTFDLDGNYSLSAIVSDGSFENPPSYVGEISHNVSTIGGTLRFPAGSLRSYHFSINGMTSVGGRLKIHDNQLTSGPQTSSPHGIALYRVDNVDVYANEIVDSGAGGRLLLVDSGSDNNRVYDNTLVANGTPNSAFRMRYGSNNNEVYGNSITCNAGGAAMFLGAGGIGNVVHHNNLSASDFVVRFEESYSTTDFYGNVLTVTPGQGVQRAIYLLEYGNVMAGITFSNDQIIRADGVTAKPIQFADTGDGGPENIHFCPVLVDGVVLTPANQFDYIQRGSGTGTSYTVGGEGCVVNVQLACDDDQDNDGDGLADFPEDPGCSSAADTSELNAAVACDDGQDNDGDGLTDTEDPACTSVVVNDENNCGNAVVDGTEQCDGSVPQEATCTGFGFDRGELACDASCSYDTAACEADCEMIDDKSSWSVAFVDSEDLSSGNPLPGAHGVDGDEQTFWHTVWTSSPAPSHPHEIVVDMGDETQICGLSYLPRQDDGVEDMDGTIRNYQFYVSADGVNWGQPVTSGQLVEAGSQDKSAVRVYFNSTAARYVRLVALNDTEGTPYTSMGELDLLAGIWPGVTDPPPPPSGVTRTDTLGD
ncbi:MAG: hypothetical protein GY716_18840 [bacterium]|nr:hypothetical protein [bacterium]